MFIVVALWNRVSIRLDAGAGNIIVEPFC